MSDKPDSSFSVEDRIAWWFVRTVVKAYLTTNQCILTDKEVDEVAENGYHLASAIKRARAKILMGAAPDDPK